MPNLIDLTGKTFGRLTVLARGDNNCRGCTQWLCKCACGNIRLVFGQHLTRGHSKSCGCLGREVTRKRSLKHGYGPRSGQSSTYIAWKGMNRRCHNPRDKEFHNYGGRGIAVCPEWRKFENFLRDMGEKPTGLSLDRVDVNGHYCRSNCRWATIRQQARNTRVNRLITFRGETRCLADWGEVLGVNPQSLSSRLNFCGWSEEKTLSTPIRSNRKKVS